ncbi:ATP-binding cassette domain-containing protein [Naasia lichenicola]|uniref:ABC transporter ATP-binding protein n=1 Tax=Naasia lichenicola TaxID=2565933 RepID=A0A4S4FMU8_9MICO|nr:ATP-binding cassette domain-containing protein [Naasia lichenicola]THG31581.1 ABC transporter ATP-binding protein [Naasia lichenicola]
MSEVLRVVDLHVSYRTRGIGSRPRSVIHGVDLAVQAGETLALVGESGSGKSTIGNAILGLVPIESGSVLIDGTDVAGLSRRGRREMSRTVQAIFQNPYGSLNPWITVGQTLAEPLKVAGRSRAEIADRLRWLLERVRLPQDALDRYPSEFSGGQRQRIAIARAIALEPRLVVCDEPTSALDVLTQAAVLRLLRELQDDLGIAYLFITHDLAIVREFAARVGVLRSGEIVESGDAEEVCDAPRHPYTRQLVAAAPVPDPVLQRVRRAARLAGGGEVDADS